MSEIEIQQERMNRLLDLIDERLNDILKALGEETECGNSEQMRLSAE